MILASNISKHSLINQSLKSKVVEFTYQSQRVYIAKLTTLLSERIQIRRYEDYFHLVISSFFAHYECGSKVTASGDAAHIVMNGTPMLILGGELSNSAATSIADIDSVMPRMARMGLNTVLVPAQWDLMEADEGKFDFSLIDETINRARENHLKVIFCGSVPGKTP